jgi:hypothetical protein
MTESTNRQKDEVAQAAGVHVGQLHDEALRLREPELQIHTP